VIDPETLKVKMAEAVAGRKFIAFLLTGFAHLLCYLIADDLDHYEVVSESLNWCLGIFCSGDAAATFAGSFHTRRAPSPPASGA
jgi:hypothetical protein